MTAAPEYVRLKTDSFEKALNYGEGGLGGVADGKKVGFVWDRKLGWSSDFPVLVSVLLLG
jgi:hypothetical protein